MNKLDSAKLKTVLQKTLFIPSIRAVNRMKDKLKSGRKYLQTKYPTKDTYLEYLKNSQKNSTISKQTT